MYLYPDIVLCASLGWGGSIYRSLSEWDFYVKDKLAFETIDSHWSKVIYTRLWLWGVNISYNDVNVMNLLMKRKVLGS